MAEAVGVRFSQFCGVLTHTSAGDDEWFPLEPMATTFATLAEAPCARVLYVPKWSVYLNWIRPQAPPPGVSVFGGAGLVPRSRAQLVHGATEAGGARVYFLGDLDPYDLTIFLSLGAGGVGGESAFAGPRFAVEYLGVGNALIDLCERHARPDCQPLLERVTITMTDFERRHLRLLEQHWPEVESVVGGRAMALLRSGRKLELEGATNPAIYDDAFPAALRRLFYGEAT